MSKSTRSRRRARSVAALAGSVTALSLLLTACGGGKSDSAKSATAADTAGITAAKTAAETYRTAPTSIGVTKPVGKPIPTGKTIVNIGAGPGGLGTIIMQNEMAKAVGLLGWKLKFIQPQAPTPQLFQQALDQAIALHPDAVLINTVEVAPVANQLAKLKAAHIPVISNTAPDPSGGPIVMQIYGVDALGQLATAIADKILADMGKPGTIGIADIQGYTIINRYVEVFKREIGKRCPSCELVTTAVSAASLGTTAGSDITNFVRAHSGMDALFVGYDGMGTNLFSAARSAGVTLPKTYSLAPAPASIPSLADGQLTASAAFDQGEEGWRTLDALARVFTGQTDSALEQDAKYPRPMVWSKSFGNVPAKPSGNTFPDVVENYRDQYKKLWGK
ncbi:MULTISPECIES: sugar ABC transporter substrate-binding protein [unclassified Streptomyces]|uniref:sugar ABC transporter substrate-binding protein n=1 Tax=unclassified Streptomyces TaxID=2593676 RepID=UPI0001D06BBB|nr:MULTISPECIES: substrate-binding domain-containing protein [unclassified Streptomyces]EFF89098.1 serine/arginine repetitive matrix protein 1 [Streptomyces sp. e14]MYS44114.1 substrate-binding domain-containing protein [Streptomyces sp. SID5998]NED33248.1 substrate-binding domain-containing protein [Streptomyces sp. SID8499]